MFRKAEGGGVLGIAAAEREDALWSLPGSITGGRRDASVGADFSCPDDNSSGIRLP